MEIKFEKDGRAWLTDNRYETSAVIRHVSASTYGDNSPLPKYIEATLILKDCNRTIQLDFDANEKKAYQSRLDKITTLIDELTEFKMNLMDAAAICADGWKEDENAVSG